MNLNKNISGIIRLPNNKITATTVRQETSVTSVNNKTGDVILTASDIEYIPDTSVKGGLDEINSSIEELGGILNTEISIRYSEDQKLDQSIQEESALRAAADTNITSELQNEITRATNAEAQLENSLATEVGRVEGLITTEASTRAQADNSLQEQINSKQPIVSDLETIRSNAQAGKDHSEITSGNPHQVTKAEVGLGDVDNTSDLNKPISTATQNAITAESERAQAAENELQEQIDAIESKTDVVDIVANKAELDAYDTTKLYNNDVVKVLEDETKNNAISYYRWVKPSTSSGSWSYLGSLGPFYTKAETQELVTNTIDALDNPGQTAATGEVISAVSETNGVISVSKKALAEADIPTLSQSKITGVADHTSNTSIHTTASEKSTWNSKQAELVSGTNIKTINGASILGSGNLEISTDNIYKGPSAPTDTSKLWIDTDDTSSQTMSVVGVSATGTSTDEVNYITIDGVEKKIGGTAVEDFEKLKARVEVLENEATTAEMAYVNSELSLGLIAMITAGAYYYDGDMIMLFEALKKVILAIGLTEELRDKIDTLHDFGRLDDEQYYELIEE